MSTPHPPTTPFLIEDAAVIDCPWCFVRFEVDEDAFNRRLVCGSCHNALVVEVSDDRRIDYACPNCTDPQSVSDRMAGREVYCVRRGCGFGPFLVPSSPVTVWRIDPKLGKLPPLIPEPPRTGLKIAKAVAVGAGSVIAAVAAAVLSGGKKHDSYCKRCRQRHVRNPTGICHVCQRNA